MRKHRRSDRSSGLPPSEILEVMVSERNHGFSPEEILSKLTGLRKDYAQRDPARSDVV